MAACKSFPHSMSFMIAGTTTLSRARPAGALAPFISTFHMFIPAKARAVDRTNDITAVCNVLSEWLDIFQNTET